VAARGSLLVISAPSGTGKSTVCRRLRERVRDLEFSVSYTTRPRREGEQEGQDYHFVSPETFQTMIERGEFLEWASVFGRLYGTGLDRTRRAVAEGRELLLDIDVQGARKVRVAALPSVSIMLLPPDYGTLRERLRGRASESEAELDARLAWARREAESFDQFDYVVVNSELDCTVTQLESIVRAERSRPARQTAAIEEILATFPAPSGRPQG
jgi:guanylate kinase